MQSKSNLELKHFCPDFSKVRSVLKEMGAKKEAVKDQKDYFFDLPSAKKKTKARMKLRMEGKRQEIIYYERPDFIVGKETSSAIKLYDVADRKLLPFLQASLGVIAIVEKKREVWRIEHTVFFLDTVRNVGNIFEVELQKMGKINDKDRKLFKTYQVKLLPYLGKMIKGSNVDLVLKK